MPRKKRQEVMMNQMGAEEQEAANCLLQLAQKSASTYPAYSGTLTEGPKKRGRKPKLKRSTPQLMKKTQKVYKNYKKLYNKMPDTLHSVDSAIQKLDWEKPFPGFDPNYSSFSTNTCLEAPPSPEWTLEKKISKLRIKKSSESACWSSHVVSKEDPVESPSGGTACCLDLSFENTYTPANSSLDSLPDNCLPFKKRKFDWAGTKIVKQESEPSSKTDAPRDHWEPSIPEFLLEQTDSDLAVEDQTDGSPRKMNILEQACFEAGIEKCDDSASDDIEVLSYVNNRKEVQPLPTEKLVFETQEVSVLSTKPVLQQSLLIPPALNIATAVSVTAPYTQTVGPAPNELQNQWPCGQVPIPSFNTYQQPLNLCNRQGLTVVSADVTICKNAAAALPPPVSYPQLTSRVYFRILSDSWRILPKLSVYEMEPFKFEGPFSSTSRVGTFVLFHRQRSETKSLHFLNKFPQYCEIKFEFLHTHISPTSVISEVDRIALPGHMVFQPTTDDLFASKESFEMLKGYFPGSTMFCVQENQKLVVNKVAVSEVNEHSGAVHIKVYAFSSVLLDKAFQPMEKVYDPWFSKSTDTVEVFRLTMPAWMFFSREVIRLHSV
ncbi:uncharacterized protein LOC132202109 isoform X3 [Neocloeon triangulifer]|uniref:uncharacterized protein LOC132202109 isoform X3 n=1 Tax=Neocloeon triangulifer TaxID=2078957 RepID=UPI00286ED05F|nr:uncharacterized protein LOC132202109 isoform X3 [Neocloeon triangulifer]